MPAADAISAAGEPQRAAVRRALLVTLGCSALFTTFAILTTQDKSLRAHSPWQDDPYDVVVSFTQLVVPVLAAAIAARMLGCSKDRPLAAGRMRDLLRGARIAIAAVGLTAAADWVAVALGAYAPAWGGQGTVLIAALAIVTVMALASAATIRTADRQAGARRRYAPQAQEPDWVDDLIAVVLEQTRRWGRAGRSLGRLADWLQRVVMDGRHGLRLHQVAAALGAAVMTSVALAVTQAAREGGAADPAAAVAHGAVTVTIGASGLFAALLAAGSYLRILRPPATRQAEGHRSRPTLVLAGFAAAASVPVSVAFRGQIGAFLGYPINGTGRLALLTLTIATTAALAAVLARLAARRHQRSGSSRTAGTP